jgi:CheY-like chemotaxis protein
MEALLGTVGRTGAEGAQQRGGTLLCEQSGVDTVLADYHLGDGIDGIELLRRLRDRAPPLAAALISADHDADLIWRRAMPDFRCCTSRCGRRRCEPCSARSGARSECLGRMNRVAPSP